MSFLSKLFGSSKPETETLCAAAAGTIVPAAELPDPVFAQEMMGPTIAVLPSQGEIAAPAAGVISAIYPTGHAFGITTPQGAELLVHIGIDTVGLNGKGFRILKKEGDSVCAGEPVVQMDLAVVQEANLYPGVMTILTNGSDFQFQDQKTAHSVSKGDVLSTIVKHVQ